MTLCPLHDSIMPVAKPAPPAPSTKNSAASTGEVATTKAAPDPMSCFEWALAFERKLDELRADVGRNYLTTIVATLWPKHHADDPARVAVQWAAGRQAQ